MALLYMDGFGTYENITEANQQGWHIGGQHPITIDNGRVKCTGGKN